MAGNKDLPVEVGEMRYRVTLAKRKNVPDDYASVIEEFEAIQDVWAAINPISLQSFIGAEQIVMPITHRIYIRWQPNYNLQFFNVLLKTSVMPDGSKREEVYRIRQVQEWQGKHFFTVIDAELEKSVDR